MILPIVFFVLSLICLVFISVTKRNELLSKNRVRLPIMGGFILFFVLFTIFSFIFIKNNIKGNGENYFKVGGLFLIISYFALACSLLLPIFWHDKHSNLISIICFAIFAVLLIISLIMFIIFGSQDLNNSTPITSSSLISLGFEKYLLI